MTDINGTYIALIGTSEGTVTGGEHPVWSVAQELCLRDTAELWTVHGLYVDQIRYVHLRRPIRPGGFTNLRVRDDLLRAHQRALARDAARDRTPAVVFAARLRELRVERDFTQDELARLAKMHSTRLGRIESGRVNVGLEII